MGYSDQITTLQTTDQATPGGVAQPDAGIA